MPFIMLSEKTSTTISGITLKATQTIAAKTLFFAGLLFEAELSASAASGFEGNINLTARRIIVEIVISLPDFRSLSYRLCHRSAQASCRALRARASFCSGQPKKKADCPQILHFPGQGCRSARLQE